MPIGTRPVSSPDTRPSPRVTVVVPNWNGTAHLPECFAALDNQDFRDFRTILVDNDSSDGSVDWVRTNAPSAVTVLTERNGGFAYAVNAGVRASASEYVALLNNDTAVDPGWLGELVGALDRHRDYSIAASLMVFYAEPDVVNAAGDLYSLRVGVGYNRGFGDSVAGYLEPVRVLGACAGAALYRRAVFETVGEFDESFFLGAEDTDFNVRALIAGERALYVPTAVVRHKLGASRNAKPSRHLEDIESRNNGVIIGRDLPASSLAGWVLLSPWRLLRDSVPVRPSKWPGLRHRASRVFRSYRATIRGVASGIRDRRRVWDRRRVPVSEIRHWLRHGVGPLGDGA
jgi:GT2 family glycosyltransferase